MQVNGAESLLVEWVVLVMERASQWQEMLLIGLMDPMSRILFIPPPPNLMHL